MLKKYLILFLCSLVGGSSAWGARIQMSDLFNANDPFIKTLNRELGQYAQFENRIYIVNLANADSKGLNSICDSLKKEEGSKRIVVHRSSQAWSDDPEDEYNEIGAHKEYLEIQMKSATHMVVLVNETFGQLENAQCNDVIRQEELRVLHQKLQLEQELGKNTVTFLCMSWANAEVTRLRIAQAFQQTCQNESLSFEALPSTIDMLAPLEVNEEAEVVEENVDNELRAQEPVPTPVIPQSDPAPVVTTPTPIPAYTPATTITTTPSRTPAAKPKAKSKAQPKAKAKASTPASANKTYVGVRANNATTRSGNDPLIRVSNGGVYISRRQANKVGDAIGSFFGKTKT